MKIKKNPEPEPKPGVMAGDEVFFRHSSGDRSGIVGATGKHGCTIHCDGAYHKVRWAHIHGHKRRASQHYNVIESGEDGHIVEDAAGIRRYIGIANEAREDPLVAKADKPGGSFAGRPGLTQKQITDRTGRRQTKWVRVDKDVPKERKKAAPKEAEKDRDRSEEGQPARKKGDKVHFNLGDLKGSGKIIGQPGKDGAHVKDSSGRVHQVRWNEMHDEGVEGGEPERPDYAPRNEGESDKQYAKRAIDTLPEPKHLPEKHDRYFNTEGSTKVPLDKLHSSKSDEENLEGGTNGHKRMLAAYHGKLSKRDPITVMPHATKKGHYEVVDGNGTYTSVKKHGWKHLPVKVVDRDEGSRILSESKAKDLAAKAADPKKYEHLPKKAMQPVSDKDELYGKAGEALKQLHSWLDESAVGKLGFSKMSKSPLVVSSEEWAKHKGMLFIADLKQADGRAKEKVEGEYGGNWSKLLDVVRCTLAVDNLNHMADVIRTLEQHGMKPMQQPKNKFTKPTPMGYRDINFVVEMPNGIAAEVQFNVKDILRAKNEGHKYYEVTRRIEEKYAKEGKNDQAEWDPADRDAFNQALDKQVEIYNSAWADHVKKHYGNASNMIKSFREVILLLSRPQ